MPTIEEFSEVPTRINLRREFPVAARSILQRSFAWLVVFGILLLTITVADHLMRSTHPLADISLQVFDLFCMVAIVTGTVLVIGKLIYELLLYLLYSFEVEMEHLVITKGLIFRARASVPIARINDVSLHRGPSELIFNLYQLRIMSPSPLADLTHLHGLSPKNAVGLQNRILSLVETTLPRLKEAEAEEKVTPPEEPRGYPGFRAEAPLSDNEDEVAFDYDVEERPVHKEIGR